MDCLKRNKKIIKEEIGELIYDQLFKSCYSRHEINEYIESRNLNNILIKIYLSIH